VEPAAAPLLSPAFPLAGFKGLGLLLLPAPGGGAQRVTRPAHREGREGAGGKRSPMAARRAGSAAAPVAAATRRGTARCCCGKTAAAPAPRAAVAVMAMGMNGAAADAAIR